MDHNLFVISDILAIAFIADIVNYNSGAWNAKFSIDLYQIQTRLVITGANTYQITIKSIIFLCWHSRIKQ